MRQHAVNKQRPTSESLKKGTALLRLFARALGVRPTRSFEEWKAKQSNSALQYNVQKWIALVHQWFNCCSFHRNTNFQKKTAESSESSFGSADQLFKTAMSTGSQWIMKVKKTCSLHKNEGKWMKIVLYTQWTGVRHAPIVLSPPRCQRFTNLAPPWRRSFTGYWKTCPLCSELMNQSSPGFTKRKMFHDFSDFSCKSLGILHFFFSWQGWKEVLAKHDYRQYHAVLTFH